MHRLMNTWRLFPLFILAILSGCESYDLVNTRSQYYRGAPVVEYTYPINYAPYPYYNAPYYGSGGIGLYDYPVTPTYVPIYVDRNSGGPVGVPPPSPRRTDLSPAPEHRSRRRAGLGAHFVRRPGQ